MSNKTENIYELIKVRCVQTLNFGGFKNVYTPHT